MRFAFLLCIFVGGYTMVWSKTDGLAVRFCVLSLSVRLFCVVNYCFLDMYVSVCDCEWLDINIQLTRRVLFEEFLLPLPPKK